MRESANLQYADQDSRRASGGLLVRQGIWLEGRTCWQGEACGEGIFLKSGVSVSFIHEKANTESDLFLAEIANEQSSAISVKLLFACYQAGGEAFSFVSPSREAIYHAWNNKLFLITPEPGRKQTQLTALSSGDALSGRIWKCEKKGTLNYVPMMRGESSSVLLIDISVPAKGRYQGGAAVTRKPMEKMFTSKI
jgi:hypothetical protein